MLIDFAEAFDSVSWAFLDFFFNFSPGVKTGIKTCNSSIYASIFQMGFLFDRFVYHCTLFFSTGTDVISDDQQQERFFSRQVSMTQL